MVIVLDTNILVRDFNLEGVGFRLLREGLQMVDFRVCIPNIVLDETVAKFRDRVAEESMKEQKVLKTISLLLTKDRHKTVPPIDVSYEAQTYQARLYSKISEAGFETRKYPEVSHQEVVARELQRTKPFAPQHGGYRDYLIWLTVIDVVLETNDSVAFVTSNTKDFFEGDQLHPDLVRDLDARKIDQQRITPFSSLESFNDTWLKTQREAVEDVMRSLAERKYKTFDVEKWIGDELNWSFYDTGIDSVFGFPEDKGRARPRSAVVKSVTVSRAMRLRDGKVWAEVDIDGKINVDIELKTDDFFRHPRVIRDLDMDKVEPGEWSWDEDRTFNGTAAIILDTVNGQLDEGGLREVFIEGNKYEIDQGPKPPWE